MQRDQRVNEISSRAIGAFDRAMAQDEAAQKRAAEARVKREEMQADAAARQRLANDKADLCRMEYERYGKTISC